MAFRFYSLEKNVRILQNDYAALTADRGNLEEAFDTILYEDHLHFLTVRQLEQAQEALKSEYEAFKADAEGERLAQIEEVYSAYNQALAKIERNSGVGLDTQGAKEKLDDWAQKFLSQEWDTLAADINAESAVLDQQYQQYLATLPTPTPVPTSPPVVAAAGYSFQSVSTERGAYSTHLIKLRLSEYTVKTLAANDTDCTDNCPAKSLAQYITENNAYAGIHGSYFCPPDYAACAGKVNSYDFAVYDSNTQSWRNEHTLQWYNNGLAAFNGTQHLFYDDIQQYYFQHGGGGVTAGLSNFPSLVQNGNVIVDEGELTNAQKTKGVRGAIGVDGTYLYLAISSGASVTDMGYVMKALGAQHALNLDGGGSAAMHIGGAYKVGPGRQLPNAIVLVRR